MLVRLVNLLSALLSPILGKLFSFLEPYATGDGTMSLLLRGFAIRRRHASRLQQVARAIHAGALRGKVVLVTGTGRGLGSGIAAHLAAGGVQLILPQRKGGDVPVLRQRLARTGTDAMRACAKDPHAVPQLAPSDIDVRSPSCGLEMGSLASIDRFVDELASQGVLLDGLINNAGMVPISGGVTAEGFEPAFGINYLGTVHLTLELHRRGLLKPDATIVNVTSEEHRLASFASVLDAPLPSTQQEERRLDAHLGALPVDASDFNCGNCLCVKRLCGNRLCGNCLCGKRLCGNRLCGNRLCGNCLCGNRLCGNRLCGNRLCGNSLCGNRLDSVRARILRDRPHERLTKQWGDQRRAKPPPRSRRRSALLLPCHWLKEDAVVEAR